MAKSASQVSEKDVEIYLRDQVKKELHGKAYKWVCPGCVGVPDRMVCLPMGKVVFVELKAPGKKPTPIQLARHGELFDLGYVVYVLDSHTAVDAFIAKYRAILWTAGATQFRE